MKSVLKTDNMICSFIHITYIYNIYLFLAVRHVETGTSGRIVLKYPWFSSSTIIINNNKESMFIYYVYMCIFIYGWLTEYSNANWIEFGWWACDIHRVHND